MEYGALVNVPDRTVARPHCAFPRPATLKKPVNRPT